jgi:hypothetical protein|tara:strand:- start:2254 stop:2754 length:501 start_codon:yes stop_codon:yes gene_type:complete
MSQINVNTIALANGTEQARLVQVVNVTDSAVATGSTTMNSDNTIPQITEGNEWMTLAITPTNASNKLFIEVVVQVASSSSTTHVCAIFQDSTAGAISAVGQNLNGTNTVELLNFSHYMTAGITSATTFRVRTGGTSASTFTFNGASGARLFGGVSDSSITISEIRV